MKIALWSPAYTMCTSTLRSLTGPITRISLYGTTAVEESCPRENAVAAIKARPFEAIPGPRGLPVIGTSFKYLPGGEFDRRYPLKAGFRKFYKYGPLVKEYVGFGQTILNVYSPEALSTIFNFEGKWPERVGIRSLRKYRLSRNRLPGIVALNGPEWYSLRSRVNRDMMRPASIYRYLPAQSKVADDLATLTTQSRDSRGDVSNYGLLLQRYTLEAIGVVCFDDRMCALEGLDAPDYLKRTIEITGNIVQAMGNLETFWFWHQFGRSKLWKKYVEDSDNLWSLTEKYSENCLHKISQNVTNDHEAKSLLEYLLSHSDTSKEEAFMVIHDLFNAGIESTAHAITFALYHLAKNPEVQDKVYQELQHHVTKSGCITEQHLAKLPYLKAVIKESSRLLPVANQVARKLTSDLVLHNLSVPAGTLVLIFTDVLGRLPEYWDDPDEFIPDRFIRSNEKYTVTPFTSLPFGHGVRSCIGRRFAEQEVLLALIKILRSFKVEYPDGELQTTNVFINKPAVPVTFRFSERVSIDAESANLQGR